MYRSCEGIFSAPTRTLIFEKPWTYTLWSSKRLNPYLTRRLQFWAVQKCWWWPHQASRMCLCCILRCIGHAKALSVPNPEPLIFEKSSTHIRCYLYSDTTHSLTRRLQFWAVQKCLWWSCRASRRCLCCVLWCIGHAKAFSVPNPEPLIFEKPSTHIRCYLSSDTFYTLTWRLQFELCRSVDYGLVKPLEDASVVFFDVYATRRHFQFQTPNPWFSRNRRNIYAVIFQATQPILWHAAFSF